VWELLIFWLAFVIVCEMRMSPINSNYTVTLLFMVILLATLMLFLRGYDLFGSIMVALYSSVLIVINLLFVYVQKYLIVRLQSQPITSGALLFEMFLISVVVIKLISNSTDTYNGVALINMCVCHQSIS